MDCRSWDLDGFIEPALKVCRESYRILEGNKTATKRYGYSRSEWRRLSLLALHPASEHQAVRTWIDPPQKPPQRFTHLSKTGESFSIQMNIIAASQQHEPQAVVLIQDIFHKLDPSTAFPGDKGRCEPCFDRTFDDPDSLQSLTGSNKRLQMLLDQLITALGAVVECRDPYTADHQLRVARIAESTGQLLRLDEDAIEGLRVASLLHDIGKLTIPAELLSKPGRLSDVQSSLVHSHAQAGYEILKKIDFPWPVAQIVLQHHERLDGSGYPNHVIGSGILFESRILAVADTLDAMNSHRPYRPALGIEKALGEIAAGSGSLYDSRVVDACLALHTESRLFVDV